MRAHLFAVESQQVPSRFRDEFAVKNATKSGRHQLRTQGFGPLSENQVYGVEVKWLGGLLVERRTCVS